MSQSTLEWMILAKEDFTALIRPSQCGVGNGACFCIARYPVRSSIWMDCIKLIRELQMPVRYLEHVKVRRQRNVSRMTCPSRLLHQPQSTDLATST